MESYAQPVQICLSSYSSLIFELYIHKQFMLKFKRVYHFSKWPIVDLLDYNHQINLLKSQPAKPYIPELLGPNYEKYQHTSIQFDYVSHNQEPSEIQVLSSAHPEFKQADRIFSTFDQLKYVRETESLKHQKFALKEIEEDDVFTVDAMQSYKPKLTCDNLTENQLLLINLPINVTIQEVQDFVQSKTNQQVQVELHTCSLNINAYATLTFQNQAEQYKSQLHLTKFNGILQECRSLENTAEESPFNRTLVITNINKTLSLQEVLHTVGQYGRVLNAVIPLEVQNVDLPLYEDIIQTLVDPCKIEILNVQTGLTEIEFYPNLEQFEQLYKNFPEYYDPKLELTLFEYQQQKDQKQDQFRLFRLLNQKTVKCLKVPSHLKENYKKLWVPQINVETPKDNLQYQLYAKTYKNRGYCVCTFSSKAMAQRALFAINAEGTHDLAVLSLPLLNTPKFYPEITSHSNQEKYGGKFRIENLAYPKLRAMKSWEDLELYQIDLIYNLKQLERIRTQISQVRDQTIEAIQTNYDTYQKDLEEKKEKVKQKAYSELNKSDEYKNFVEKNSFAESLDSFEDSVAVVKDTKPGRKFNFSIHNEQYKNYVEAIKDRAKDVKLKEKEYADKLVKKYQTIFISDSIQRKLEKNVEKSDDTLLSLLQARVLGGYAKKERKMKKRLTRGSRLVSTAAMYAADSEMQFKRIGELFSEIQKKGKYVINEANRDSKEAQAKLAQKIALRRQRKFKRRFSSTILNPFYLKKLALQKHEEFLEYIKKMLLGDESQNESLIAIHPLNHKDQLKVSLALAKDDLGNEFLNDKIINYVREFDITDDTRDLIRQQEANRKHLMSQITKDQIARIKEFSKQSYTQKLISLDKHGITTETFEVTDNEVDINQMVKDLNTFVAVGSEKYDFVVDKLTKKRYIIKSEKPFVKYDLDAFSIKDLGVHNLEKEFVDLLSKNGIQSDKAIEMLKALENDGQISEEILDLIDKLPENTETDYEKIYQTQGLTRKSKSLDFRNNLDEIQNDIDQQAYLKDISKKYSPLTNDTFVRDKEQGKLKIKNKNGKFLVPKQKKY
ncbi:unnamed protein product (macronuclear) [Paramecium tetraurelia]|uniref:RRM domain-containing protein n=1 Tax=Paramecium tetraurelia TaxID=5888 RepID=A0DPL8_PARTE|nr:uncharacterized protein GSPATT00019167001 [Paramecium tetraurelia]CAK84985.1 unnamed protein product [Paramecium tetraurelia]|eukprot:XP_001452382.1 hypothetical protein (macronuclear) [Paramecium tetraurelia strain d4-2]